MANTQVSEQWVRWASILISEVKALCEASHDGREVPFAVDEGRRRRQQYAKEKVAAA